MKLFGIVLPADELPADDDHIVWPELQPVVGLFSRCQTQWQIAPMGGVIGLNYAGVAQVMSMYGIGEADRAQYWADLQTMEYAAVAEINKNR